MASEDVDPATAYYFNTRTGAVEQGFASDWTDRMGPYATREQAQNALQNAARRNREMDEADRAYDGDED